MNESVWIKFINVCKWSMQSEGVYVFLLITIELWDVPFSPLAYSSSKVQLKLWHLWILVKNRCIIELLIRHWEISRSSCWCTSPLLDFSLRKACLRYDTGQEKQFEDELFKTLGNTFGMTRWRTCSYYPCANGVIWDFHRHLESAPRCHPTIPWIDALPLVLLGLRCILN